MLGNDIKKKSLEDKLLIIIQEFIKLTNKIKMIERELEVVENRIESIEKCRILRGNIKVLEKSDEDILKILIMKINDLEKRIEALENFVYSDVDFIPDFVTGGAN